MASQIAQKIKRRLALVPRDQRFNFFVVGSLRFQIIFNADRAIFFKDDGSGPVFRAYLAYFPLRVSQILLFNIDFRCRDVLAFHKIHIRTRRWIERHQR